MSIIQAAGNNHPGLNDKEQSIFTIIKGNTCSFCKGLIDYHSGRCFRYKTKCINNCAKQAQEIYSTLFQPYEDDLK